MSLDELLTERLRAVVREVLDERLAGLESRLEQLGLRAPAKAVSDDDELSLKQIHSQYGYVPDTVRGWIHEGELAAKKGAKEWRVRRGDLLAKLGRSRGPASVVDIRSKADKILAGGRNGP